MSDIIERLSRRRIPVQYGEFTDYLEDKDCQDAANEIKRLREALRPLYHAAYGLSFGEDWNNGTHTKMHGYRQKLLDALPAARAALGEGKE